MFADTISITTHNKTFFMTPEHVAIWTANLEKLKAYYMKYFGGIPNAKFTNEKNQFSSYFLAFKSGQGWEL